MPLGAIAAISGLRGSVSATNAPRGTARQACIARFTAHFLLKAWAIAGLRHKYTRNVYLLNNFCKPFGLAYFPRLRGFDSKKLALPDPPSPGPAWLINCSCTCVEFLSGLAWTACLADDADRFGPRIDQIPPH
jgi:hypothetical protein